MRTITVALAGQQYEVKRLAVLRAIEWRKRAQALLDKFPAIADAYEAESDNQVSAAASLYGVSNEAAEMLFEVVLDADPALKADREYIGDNADEDELFEAFQAVMLLNAPLSGALATPTAPGTPATGEAIPTT